VVEALSYKLEGRGFVYKVFIEIFKKNPDGVTGFFH
jgi:hypothetical protein